MEEMEERFKRTIEEYHMLASGDRVIAAVSGGADSVCLLALLWDRRQEWGLKLRVVHVHHGLRGMEADRDEEFVRHLCEALDVPCHTIKVNVRELALLRGMSEEEAGRYLRYEALEREAEEWETGEGGRVRIAVAHHSGDQAETILHHLFRGTGLWGLKGIPYVRGRIIRPLLDTDRREITDWLRERGLSWVQDSSNCSDHYTRNRIRCHLLPMIEEEVNRGAAGNILSLGKLAGQADEYLRIQGERWIGEHVKGNLLPCAVLLAEPEIIQSYVVLELLKRLGGWAGDLGRVHVQQVLGLAGRPVGKEVHLPHSLVARREYDSIFIGRGSSLGQNGETVLPVVEMRVFPYKKGTQFPKNLYTKWFDCDRIKDTPMVRTRRPGDFITLADGNHKALKRFMIDEKIPRQRRDQVPLLADGSHIMWVIGYRISEFYKIGQDTTQVMQAESRVEEKDEWNGGRGDGG